MFGPTTADAVRRFQGDRGIHVDGECGDQTWSALVEAGYHLGDRLLYQRHPMLRGEDVLELQSQLGALGFDAGRVDGIFGPDTARALEEFQVNSGIAADGIAGPDTIAALDRLKARRAGPVPVVGVKEAEAHRASRGGLQGRRVALGDLGGLATLASAVVRLLDQEGAHTTLLHEPDPAAQADRANDGEAEVYLGLESAGPTGGMLAYYAAGGFESFGGRHLADQLQRELGMVLTSGPELCVDGMRLPILRATRMPAVLCRLGPTEDVVRQNAAVAEAMCRAVETWFAEPVD